MTDADEPPHISVIVPTFRRPVALLHCLESLRGLHSPGVGIEVVIADDGGTVDAARAESALGRRPLIVSEGQGRGPAAARNRGAAAASGGLLLFTDDDCRPEPGWAAALWRRHQSEPCALIGGTTVNALPDNPYSRAAQAIGDAALAHHNSGFAGPRFYPSNNIAVPAGQFAEIGGFDERIERAGGEDRDFCERWIERGWPVAAERDAVVHHAHPLRLRSFWSQQRAYGAGAFHHRRNRAARGGEKRLQPALTSGLAGIAARGALRDRDVAVFLLLGVWQVAGVSGYAGAALRARHGRAIR